ncbi:hypothetical protein HWV62_34545 [Athelia sp. TMB]|nr:hypothetical protein HWV62_34545 [Athelia sp. TMB]
MPLELRGFKAWISVDEKETPCYGIEKSKDGKAVTGWIASKEGKKFSVKWTRPVHLYGTLMRGAVQVDDIKCAGRIMFKDDSPTCIYEKSGLDKSADIFSPFLFGSVDLTDDDSVLDASLSSRLGDISLSIWRTELASVAEFTPDAVPPEQQIHECAKKAILHQVKLGDEVSKACSKESYITRCLDRQPLATFTFKYRSLDVLVANGIVHRAPENTCKIADEPNDGPPGTHDPHGSDAIEAVQRAKLETDVIASASIRRKRKAKQDPKQELIDEGVPEESAAAQVLAAQITALEDEVESRQDELESRRAELLTRQAELDAGLDRLKARQEKLATLKAKHMAMVSKNTVFKRVKVVIDLT